MDLDCHGGVLMSQHANSVQFWQLGRWAFFWKPFTLFLWGKKHFYNKTIPTWNCWIRVCLGLVPPAGVGDPTGDSRPKSMAWGSWNPEGLFGLPYASLET